MYKRKPLRDIELHPRTAILLPLITHFGKTHDLAPGELLRLVRTSLRMTQKQLAERSGIDQGHITRMEAGTVDAQWKSWVRVFAALQCRLVLRVQAEGGLEGILEDRIQRTARQNVARGKKMFPDEALTEAERQEEHQEWLETLRGRRTPEIWDEDPPVI